jgi:hypothetical protein
MFRSTNVLVALVSKQHANYLIYVQTVNTRNIFNVIKNYALRAYPTAFFHALPISPQKIDIPKLIRERHI